MARRILPRQVGRKARSLEDFVQVLRRPLEHARRSSDVGLRRIQKLEEYIGGQTDAALKTSPAPDEAALLRKFRRRFHRFDELLPREKREAIAEGLRMLSGLERKRRPPESGRDIDRSIQYVKGVGPRLAERLSRRGIRTVEDALFFLPRKYQDRRRMRRIADLVEGGVQCVRGTILSAEVKTLGRTRRRIFEMEIVDPSGILATKWFQFHASYTVERFRAGLEVVATGPIRSYRGRKEMHHPDIEIVDIADEESIDFGRIVPIYPEPEGVHQKTLRRIQWNVVRSYADKAVGGVPEAIARSHGLLPLGEALRRVHFPSSDDAMEDLERRSSYGHRRLVFEEFFTFELGLALRKRGQAVEPGIPFRNVRKLRQRLLRALPFKLTAAQKRVLADIVSDCQRAHPMNRLLQGDVGSGKTIVALLAALAAVESRCQAVLMAPTEILAEQHLRTVSHFLKPLGIEPELLHAGLPSRTRTGTVRRIRDGRASIVIGTHALIQSPVRFHRLGLAIIDEQHRFGVAQRSDLRKKGYNPHMLVMTATPIPRTLAMTLYGDLDVSVIDELPPGRPPIRTKLFREQDRDEVYRMVRREVGRGRQVYVVYPIIEESEKLDLRDATRMTERFKSTTFPQFAIGLVHGKLPSEEKDRIMNRFAEGKIQILVATTVIEVGIDVPNASVMVIEHAERFGLSQLHQLRGRVGRGSDESFCLLLADAASGEEARRRLAVMEATQDGFQIAEEDLAIRGPGEFIGTRQSGMPDFRVANLARDAALLAEARRAAFKLVEKDPKLKKPGHRELLESLERRWGERLDLVKVG